jgi:hypothetical protein
VEAVDVPSLLDGSGAGRIDLLKLDIEGAELEVLRDGADRWIDLVETLVDELHDRFRPGCSEALERAVGRRGSPRAGRGLRCAAEGMSGARPPGPGTRTCVEPGLRRNRARG